MGGPFNAADPPEKPYPQVQDWKDIIILRPSTVNSAAVSYLMVSKMYVFKYHAIVCLQRCCCPWC